MRKTLITAVMGTVVLLPQITLAQGITMTNVTAECTRTMQLYAHYIDHLDADAYANLFVEDGVFILGRDEFVGREAIAQWVREDDGRLIGRHMTGSIVIDADESAGITARSYVFVYRGERPATPGPVPLTGYVMAEYQDQLRMTDSGCKFVRRVVTPVFIGEF